MEIEMDGSAGTALFEQVMLQAPARGTLTRDLASSAFAFGEV